MREFKLRVINAFFIYVLVVVITSLYLFYTFKEQSYLYVLIDFLIISVFFALVLRMLFSKMIGFLEEQLKALSLFIEKGEVPPLKDSIFEELYNELLLKSQELKQIINDFVETNSLVKVRISDVVYSFEDLLEDYQAFNQRFTEMVEYLSSLSKEEFDLEVEDKLQSFITLTVEIGKFKEQLMDLVERVKDIVNDYIVRTSEDIKNANFVIKGFLSFSETLVLNIDKIILFFTNLNSHSEKLMDEIKKIEKHKNTLQERIGTIRDNFDNEKELFDEIVGVNRTVNDVFYQLKALLIEVSNLNKKTSLMSLNALIYASDTSGKDKKFGTVAKELKKLVEEIEKKYVAINSFFDDLMEKNNASAKLLSDLETVIIKNRVELSKIATDIEHLSHHTKMSQQSYSHITDPIEDNVALLNSIKEGVINHSSSIKQVLTVFKDYLVRLEKAEKDRESFDNLVVSTSSLLEFINSKLPSITNYITELLRSLEKFSKELIDANNKIEKFANDKTVKDFGTLLTDIQNKRLANLKNSLILLDKAKNIKKIL